MKLPFPLLMSVVLVTSVFADAFAADAARYWPQWRGPGMTGVSTQGNPPLRWGETENVRWKVELAGTGSASPVVWEDRIFLLTAEPVQAGPREERPVHRFMILAIDRETGDTVWRRVVRETRPHQGTHQDGTYASHSAVTDGEHVFAYFGSRGLYCFDMDGNLQWEKDLGRMNPRMGFGEGSSPALHGDRIVVNWDHEDQSFIVALNKRTGEEIWRVNRDEITTWSTPLIVDHGGRAQVVTTGTNRVRSYDLDTGEVIWTAGGLTVNAIPSPVYADGIVYVASGFRGNVFKAIRLEGARGDLSGSDAILWRQDRDAPYVPSPLLYEGKLYFLKGNTPILFCVDARSGKAYYGPQRLDGLGTIYSSPVTAADRIYITSREGRTLVIEHGPEFRVLATNSLEDRIDASPAIVDDEIYFRGSRYLYAIAQD